jgi:[histone H3]-dimethyl-L-lysine9 demethylase
MCSTSIFHQTLLCRHCGREACLDCAKSISSIDEAVLPSLKRQRSNTGQPRSTDTKHNLMLIKCQPQTFHRIDDFIPTTRFDKSILQRVVNEMGSLRESSLRDVAVRRLDVSDSIDSGFAELPAHKLPIHVSGNGEDPQMAFWTPLSIQSSELTEEVFKILWQKHEPLVVRDVYVGQTWSPTELSEKYGSMACTVVDCHSEGTMQKMTVETFFARFGRYENRKRSWKLKVCGV